MRYLNAELFKILIYSETSRECVCIFLASVGCVVVVAVTVMVYCLFRAWRRRTCRVAPITSRSSTQYSVAYHAENPVYDEVARPRSVSQHEYENLPRRMETVTLLPATPRPPVYQACSTSRPVTPWDSNANEDVTTAEMGDFVALQNWGRGVQKKTHKKEEWMEMTIFK